MCGFAGITSSNWESLHALRRGVKARAFDSEHIYNSEDFSLYHAHLKISDLELNTDQPYVDEKTITSFTGEIYNKSSLAKEINIKVPVSEVNLISKLYCKYGPGFVNKINGEFAIVIFDKIKKSTFLFRDRYGTKSLYYTTSDTGELLFSSNISSLITKDSRLSKFNLYFHFIFGFGISPYSLLHGVYRVQAGSFLEYKNHTLTTKKYDAYLQMEDGSFLDTLENAVIRRVPKSQDTIFIGLSGGLDSSIVAYFLKKNFPGKIVAYSFEGKHNKGDIEIARYNAKILGIEHHIISIPTKIESTHIHESLVELPNLYKYIRKEIPSYKHVKVEFGGDGKEELFNINSNFNKEKIRLLLGRLSHELPYTPKNIDDDFLNKQMLEYNLEMIDKISLEYGIERRLPFLDYELIRLKNYKDYNSDIENILTQNNLQFTKKKFAYSDAINFSYHSSKKATLLAAKLLFKKLKEINQKKI